MVGSGKLEKIYVTAAQIKELASTLDCDAELLQMQFCKALLDIKSAYSTVVKKLQHSSFPIEEKQESKHFTEDKLKDLKSQRIQEPSEAKLCKSPEQFHFLESSDKFEKEDVVLCRSTNVSTSSFRYNLPDLFRSETDSIISLDKFKSDSDSEEPSKLNNDMNCEIPDYADKSVADSYLDDSFASQSIAEPVGFSIVSSVASLDTIATDFSNKQVKNQR